MQNFGIDCFDFWGAGCAEEHQTPSGEELPVGVVGSRFVAGWSDHSASKKQHKRLVASQNGGL